MRRLLGIGLGLTLLLLTGCYFVGEERAPSFSVTFTLAILGDRRTVLVDAREAPPGLDSSTLEYFWDFGDGSGFQQGEPVMYHTYAQPGDYVIRLCLRVPGGASPGSGGGEPGSLPGAPGSGTTFQEYWGSARANLLDLGFPRPRVTIITDPGSFLVTPGDMCNPVLPGFALIFNATTSDSPDGRPLWFRWEIVYVDRDTNQPAPYPYEGCISCPTSPEYIRKEGSYVRVDYLPGPACSPSLPWKYRVRLWVSDDLGRTSLWEGYIYVGLYQPC